MIIFGVRSPIVVEYEETCRRLGIENIVGVSLGGKPRMLDPHRVVDIATFRPSPSNRRFLACAFAPRRREELVAAGLELGLDLADALVDPTAILARSARVGEGSFVNAGVIIGAASAIGRNVLINRATSLGHHTVLADFVSIGPGVTLTGNVRVGHGTMIGAGTTILPNLRIGAHVVIAAGSLVRGHIADDTCVAGNPARKRSFNTGRSSLYVEGGE